MTRTRIALALTMAALVVLAAAGSAHAQYEATTTTEPAEATYPEITAVRGQRVEVTGAGCAAGTEVVVTWDDGRILTRLTAAADGTFAAVFRIPLDATVGRHLVTSTCLAADGRSKASTKIALSDGEVGAGGEVNQFLWVSVVRKAAPAGSAPLARTGSSNPAPLVGIGAGALVLGAAFVYGSRRPRTA
jgi:LPXTG-motif cell wall-anchored protein